MITFVLGGLSGNSEFERWLSTRGRYVYRFEAGRLGDLAKYAAAVVQSQLVITRRNYLTDEVTSCVANDPMVIIVPPQNVNSSALMAYEELAKDAGLEFCVIDFMGANKV